MPHRKLAAPALRGRLCDAAQTTTLGRRVGARASGPIADWLGAALWAAEHFDLRAIMAEVEVRRFIFGPWLAPKETAALLGASDADAQAGRLAHFACGFRHRRPIGLDPMTGTRAINIGIFTF